MELKGFTNGTINIRYVEYDITFSQFVIFRIAVIIEKKYIGNVANG